MSSDGAWLTTRHSRYTCQLAQARRRYENRRSGPAPRAGVNGVAVLREGGVNQMRPTCPLASSRRATSWRMAKADNLSAGSSHAHGPPGVAEPYRAQIEFPIDTSDLIDRRCLTPTSAGRFYPVRLWPL